MLELSGSLVKGNQDSSLEQLGITVKFMGVAKWEPTEAAFGKENVIFATDRMCNSLLGYVEALTGINLPL